MSAKCNVYFTDDNYILSDTPSICSVDYDTEIHCLESAITKKGYPFYRVGNEWFTKTGKLLAQIRMVDSEF